MDHRMDATDTLDIAEGLGHLAKFLESAGFREAAEFVEIAALSASDQVRNVSVRTGNVEPFRPDGRRGPSAMLSGNGSGGAKKGSEGAGQHARHRAG